MTAEKVSDLIKEDWIKDRHHIAIIPRPTALLSGLTTLLVAIPT
jgi:hypothetical protein